MGVNRLTRVNELLRREIARALFRVVDPSGIDLAGISVTRVETSSNLRNTHVFVSVMGDEARQHQTLRTLMKNRTALQAEVSSHVVLKYFPHFHFTLDHSVEEGDHVLRILSELGPLPDSEPTDPESDDS